MSRRHRRPSLLLGLVVGLFCVAVALLATIGLWITIGRYEHDLEAARVRPPPLEVLVAAREVPMGQVITAEDLAMVPFPEDRPRIPPLDPNLLVGRMVVERLIVGEPIREERLAPARAGHQLEALLAQGMRAIALDIADADAGSGFVNPGDRVDVLVTLLGDDTAASETRTLLHAVRVLGVDDRILASEQQGVSLKAQVTLEVSPREAELLTHGDRLGPVRLSLIGLAESPRPPATYASTVALAEPDR